MLERKKEQLKMALRVLIWADGVSFADGKDWRRDWFEE